MQKNNSFIWFLIFAIYCAANVLGMLGVSSLSLIIVMYAFCCVCSGKNAPLTAGISSVFATVSIFLNRGAFGLFVFLAIIALCFAFSHSHSFGYTKSAFILTLIISAVIVSVVMIVAYQAMGTLTPESVITWISDGFDAAGKMYADVLKETYGASFEEMAGISFEQLVTVIKTASINVMTGVVILVASVTALIGTAASYKVKYGKMSLLDSYTLSPVGGVVILVALIVFSAANGKPMIIAANIYMALLPWFAVSGIKALRGIFVKKRPVSIFTVVTVAIIAFSVGLSAALAFLGVIDVIRGFVVYEK